MIENLYRDVVDFHSHILPGADHGTSSVEETLVQLKFAKNAGVTRIIATPHFYPHRHSVEGFLHRREKAFNLLSSGNTLDNSPSIRLGAEVLMCENLHKLPRLKDLCIYGTNILLLELPFSDVSDIHVDTVSQIMNANMDVVLAHADQYAPADIERFISVGARLQVNASALTSLFKRQDVFDWIDRGCVVALGSDIHNKDRSAYKKFLKAQKKISSKLDYICKKSDEIWEMSKVFP